MKQKQKVGKQKKKANTLLGVIQGSFLFLFLLFPRICSFKLTN